MSDGTYNPSNDFQARLARINNGEATAPEGLITPQRREAKEVRLTGGVIENAMYPLSIAGAFFLGILAVFFSRFARVHLLGASDPETDMMLALAVDGLLALAIGFVIKQMFKMTGPEWISAQTMGVTVMIATMHNLVHMAPDTFAMIFTPEWVDLTLSYTNFRTIAVAGNEFAF